LRLGVDASRANMGFDTVASNLTWRWTRSRPAQHRVGCGHVQV
jgi:uncharacterized protein (DUF2235 family)